ncbi:MAG: ectoine hydroxylase-related dioxygenase (phytanoyl-CoA dioxygenase family) [Planctomycetota bacterium]|jgi:ectoine hydroxylase-related dioxygenase (phytanoyl-CoA dioxygenase family)
MAETISTKFSRDYDSLYDIPAPGGADGEMPPSYSLGPDFSVPEAAVAQLERDGVVCIRELLDSETIDALRTECDRAVAEPSSEARFVNPPGDSKTFYYEFNLWRRHPVIRQVTFDSHLPDIAAALMRSRHVTLYYTNTFVKDPGAADKVTPWHEDGSYSRFVGDNVINMNISFDVMPAETTLKFKLGSHLRDDPLSIGPTFVPGVEYDEAMPEQAPMPTQQELDARFRTVYWAVEPGDALIFYQRTFHAGPGNTLPTRRHSTAFNFGGDGVSYDAREGFIDSPDVDPALQHGAPPAGTVFPLLR